MLSRFSEASEDVSASVGAGRYRLTTRQALIAAVGVGLSAAIAASAIAVLIAR